MHLFPLWKNIDVFMQRLFNHGSLNSCLVPYHDETIQEWMNLEDTAIVPVETGI